MTKKYSKLQLKVNAPLKLKDLTYKFLVMNNSLKKVTFSESGYFDGSGFTKSFEIFNDNTSLIYEIYYRKEVIQKISAKAYPKQNQWSLYDLKVTNEMTKNIKENIKEIHLNDGEVAWYLVKNNENVLSWSKRVFKKPLSPSDWDILRVNNPHMPNLISVGVLQPGQLIILSNSTSAKELPEYKKSAQQVQKNLDELNKDKRFDALFYAQNFEFINSALLNEEYVGMSTEPVKNADGMGASIFTTAKNTVDGTILFVEEAKNKTLGSYSQIVKNYVAEHENKSRLSNPKHFAKFEAANAPLFKDFENRISKNIFQWDTGIKTNNLRRQLKNTAFVKGANFQGGIPGYLKNMNEVGRISTKLRWGGNMMIGVSIGEAGYNIYKSTETEDAKQIRKAVLVEPLKVGGSLVGGRVGAVGATAAAVLVIGVGTGGVGLVVIGACAVLGGLGGGIVGGWLGEMVGTGADTTIEWMTK